MTTAPDTVTITIDAYAAADRAWAASGGRPEAGRITDQDTYNAAYDAALAVALRSGMDPADASETANRAAIGDEAWIGGHVPVITPDGEGYLVTCPQGCGLGTSARQPGRDAARRRALLHREVTARTGRRRP